MRPAGQHGSADTQDCVPCACSGDRHQPGNARQKNESMSISHGTIDAEANSFMTIIMLMLRAGFEL